MKIFVFGSSITSSYWNGAATYYRGIYKQLNALGTPNYIRRARCLWPFAKP